ncbi:alpha/beta hydrolase [Paenibacillus marinisediminis]
MDIVLGVAAVIALILIIIIAVSFYFYRLAIHRTSKSFLAGNTDTDQTDPSVKEAACNQEWLAEHELEHLTIQSDDGLALHGLYIKAKKPTNQTAILVHGYYCRGLDMVAYACIYYDKLGMNVLMPDNRGHGQSEGHYIGFGWHDRKDIMKWIDEVIARTGTDAEIALHGVSMGGATVLMVSGEELPSNVKAIVSDCAYTSVEEQLTFQMKQMYKLPSFPLLHTTSLVSRLRAGYSFKEANALKQVRRAKVPILFIHGDADTFVPTEMVYPLYEQCSSEKEIWLVPTAAHALARITDPKGYEKKVSGFVGRLMGTEAGTS